MEKTTNLVRVDVIKPVEQLLHHFLDFSQAELDVHVGEQPRLEIMEKKKQKFSIMAMITIGQLVVKREQSENLV